MFIHWRSPSCVSHSHISVIIHFALCLLHCFKCNLEAKIDILFYYVMCKHGNVKMNFFVCEKRDINLTSIRPLLCVSFFRLCVSWRLSHLILWKRQAACRTGRWSIKTHVDKNLQHSHMWTLESLLKLTWVSLECGSNIDKHWSGSMRSCMQMVWVLELQHYDHGVLSYIFIKLTSLWDIGCKILIENNFWILE